MARSNKNIVRNIKHYRWNTSIYIVLLVAVYIIIVIIAYLNQKHINPYLVEASTIHNDTIYTGMILRDETEIKAETSGYVNYYVPEGERAAAGQTVYTIDETGEFTSLLAERMGTDAEQLDAEQWYDLKSRLYTLATAYSDRDFSTVYTSKSKLDNTILEYFYEAAIRDLNESLDMSGYMQYKTSYSAVVLYSIDGYEAKQPSELGEADFDLESYSGTTLRSGDLVTAGGTVYKELTEDEWRLVFLLTDETEELIGTGASQITIRLIDLDKTLTLPYETVTGTDGAKLGCVTLSKYGTDYVKERFAQFEIITSDISGLKIPVSSVTTQNFYLIPKEFAAYGNDGTLGFYVVDPASGSDLPQFTSLTIYGYADDNYYVNMEEISVGNYLIQTDTSERYYIAPTAELTGVYSINQGYTLFRQIVILSQVDDMYIVQSNLSYGISVYDHIAMDASFLTEHELVK